MKRRFDEIDLADLKNTMVIRHCHSWGGQPADRKFWEGQIGDEVHDWHTKDNLKKQAVSMGLKWVVIRQHRNGQISIMESSG